MCVFVCKCERAGMCICAYACMRTCTWAVQCAKCPRVIGVIIFHLQGWQPGVRGLTQASSEPRQLVSSWEFVTHGPSCSASVCILGGEIESRLCYF